MNEESLKLLTINTHRGWFVLNHLPFGIAFAPAIFQLVLDSMLRGIPRVTCFLDDVLFTGKTQERQLQSLTEVLKTFAKRGVIINKSTFFQEQPQYLGHVITSDRIRTSDEKVAAIVNYPAPEDVQQPRSLLEAVNYYGSSCQS